MIVRYEDLRAEPQAILERVLDFLGTPATEGRRRSCRVRILDNMNGWSSSGCSG